MKVLGIGLPRTGTCSLAVALGQLGFKTCHYASMDRIGLFEAVTEVGFPIVELEETYPGSQYILTVRDLDDWLKSCESHLKYRSPGWNPFWWQQDKWQELYQQRIEEVQQIPADRLLTMNIADGWEKLCLFLGKKIPCVEGIEGLVGLQHSFPHVNAKESHV